MSNIPSNAPYRADIVGSFLRPAELKEARKQFTEGKIDRQQLKAVEDRLITDLIAKQKAHGLKVITDGEFRRSYWHLDFMWGFNGIEEIELEHGYQFHGEETTPGSIRLTGRISGKNHPFVEHFRFVKQFEEEGITRHSPHRHSCSPSFTGATTRRTRRRCTRTSTCSCTTSPRLTGR